MLLHLGIVLVYPGFVYCYNVPNARRPSSVNFLLACGCITPPYPASALYSGYGAPSWHNVSSTPRQSRRMRVRLPDEILMTSCISAYVILGSFLTRDSTLQMFSGVTVVAIQPQRSSSSNALVPNMNCLNHLKIVVLGRDWSKKQCFKLWKHSRKDFPLQ